jgi:gluconolactonase
MQVPNYLVFDAGGNLYVSDSRNWGKSNGLVYRLGPDGSAEVWSTSAPGYTNGLALSPNGEYLYVVESNPPQISRIRILPDGRAGSAELVVALPRTVPDGIAFDEASNLYIACYAPDRVYRFSTGGQLEILFDDWARMSLNAPTNLAFAGKDLDRLVVASLGGSSLVWADVGAKGARLHYPAL